MQTIWILLSAATNSSDVTPTGHQGYMIGGFIALLILGYLVYSLIRPEKF